jgi:hypothetical protein
MIRAAEKMQAWRRGPLGAHPDGSLSRITPLASFVRLCAAQIIAHSARTFPAPRSRNWRKPPACSICPDTGSTACFLKRQRLRYPARVSFRRITWVSGSVPRLCVCGMLGAARGGIGAHTAFSQSFEAGLAAITRVSRSFLGLSAMIGLDATGKRDELGLTAHAWRQLMGNDDLRGSVHGSLRVTAPDSSALCKQHPAIGTPGSSPRVEVALGLGIGLRRWRIGFFTRRLAAFGLALFFRFRPRLSSPKAV